MLNWNEKTIRHAAHAVLGLILVLILCTFLDYGVTWDEELQSQYGQAVYDYYATGFKDQRYAEIFNLYLYGGMFDGLASAFDHFTPFRVYDTRHLLNALFGLLGLWGVWRLGRVMGAGAVAVAPLGTVQSRPNIKGATIGFLALILCATTPMYYGHMFNNPKDIPFAAGIVWTIYYMYRSFAKPSASVLVKLGIILGLTLGIRVGGAMIFAFWLAPMGIATLLPLLKKHDIPTLRLVTANIFKCGWRVVLPVGILAYSVMLICWPWAQQHPVMNPLRALGEFSNFPQVVEVLLDKTNYLSTQLPWFYVPLYFGIQLPELLLLLLAVSVIFTPTIWRQMTLPQRQTLCTLSLMILFPITYAVIRHPALYDTVRHFLFAVPLMCVIAALGAHAVFTWCVNAFEKTSSHRLIGTGLIAVLAISLATQIVIMAQLHPYEYIFANQFTGGVRGAYGRYESDYWGSSFKEAAQDIQNFVASEGGVPSGKIYKIAICGPWDSAMIYLPPDYEPVVANEPAEFFLSTTRWMCQDMRPGKEIIRVERKGVPLAIVKDLRGGYEHYSGNEHEKPKP